MGDLLSERPLSDGGFEILLQRVFELGEEVQSRHSQKSASRQTMSTAGSWLSLRAFFELPAVEIG
jgi:hypothetical protein